MSERWGKASSRHITVGAEDGGEIGVGGNMPAVVAMKARDQAASQSQPEQPCRPGRVPTNYPLAAYRSTL